MTEHRHIVIIGGGAIGLSIACHLGKLGFDDLLLLERHQLTSGTSWHAAGIVGPLRASMNLTRLARYALELFAGLETETGQATGYRRTGGLWLAQRAERMAELARIRAMGERSGLETEMLGAAQIAERFPLIHCDDLAGGLWVEADGQVNPVDLCMAYAKSARDHGVEIRESSQVSAIETRAGAVEAVRLENGHRIACDKLVLAAGAWSRQLAASAGVGLPLAACEHMYLVTDVVDGLPEPMPILRDLDAGVYLKGDNGKLLLGAFEARPKPWTARADDAPFLMFDEDWEHAQPMLEAGIRRVPLLAEQGIGHFMNGPESFTPDTRQLMGETAACQNLFVAAGFNSIGIMSSAGVGKVMAEWVRDGEAPMDLWEVDIARVDPLQCGDDFLRRRLPEAVFNQFDMHWPYKQFASGRNLRRSGWHDRLLECGAVFGAPTGWERPLWFARDEAESSFDYSHGAQCWWPAARREALHCQRAVSLFELSPFAKFEVAGAGALAFLQRLCCSDVDVEVGRVRYSLMLNRRGGIEAEITLARIDRDRFRVVGGAATRFKDLLWLRRHLQADDAVEIRDFSDDEAVIGVMGPGSRALLEALGGADLDDASFPWSTHRRLRIDGVDLLALRLSYVGEPGWELHIPIAGANAVLDALLAAGKAHDLGLAGHFALDACRLEQGYRHWGHDMGPDETPYEVGLGFAVALKKNVEFIGQPALVAQVEAGWSKQLALCEVLAQDLLILHDEPVYAGDDIVGHCTSGGQGFRSGKLLAFVLFYRRESVRLDDLEIDLAGHRFGLRVLDRPPGRGRP